MCPQCLLLHTAGEERSGNSQTSLYLGHQLWDWAKGGLTMGRSPDQVLLSRVNPVIRLHILHSSNMVGMWAPGETSTLSLKWFHTGAVAAVVTGDRAYECHLTNHAVRKRNCCGPSTVFKKSLGLENGCLKAKLTTMCAHISWGGWGGYKHKIEVKLWDGVKNGHNSSLAAGPSWSLCGFRL